jgi:hypothetical protein
MWCKWGIIKLAVLAQISCPPSFESTHSSLAQNVIKTVGRFPNGIFLWDDLRCSEEELAREAIDFTGGSSIGITRNTSLLEVEAEIVVDSLHRHEAIKEIENIQTEGMWRFEKAKPCKVVEQHYHGDKWHLHVKCSPFHKIGVDEDIVLSLAKVIQKYSTEVV